MAMTESEARLKIDRARLWCMREPLACFYGRLSMQLADIFVTRGSRACTDGKSIRWRIDSVESWTDQEIRYVLLHETLHPAHGHLWRVTPDLTGNIAGDMEIEHILRAIPGIQAPDGIVTCPPEHDGKPVEVIDRALRDAQKPAPQPDPSPEGEEDSPENEPGDEGEGDGAPSDDAGNDSPGDDAGDDAPDAPSEGDAGDGESSQDAPRDAGSDPGGEGEEGAGDGDDGASDSPGDSEGGGEGDGGSNGDAPGNQPGGGTGAGSPGNGDEEGDEDACGTFTKPAAPTRPGEQASDLRDNWERAVVQAAIATAIGRGVVPGDMKAVLDDIRRPATLDWRQEMAEFVRTTNGTRNDWSRCARRHAHQRVIYPRRKPDIGLVLITRDTSGSIPPEVSAEFCAIIDDCLSTSGATGVVIDCDADIQQEQWLNPGENVSRTIMGGGGTSFVAPFERARQLADEGFAIAGMVYITDLDGDFPSEQPDFPVLWLAYGTKRQAPFGRTVEIAINA